MVNLWEDGHDVSEEQRILDQLQEEAHRVVQEPWSTEAAAHLQSQEPQDGRYRVDRPGRYLDSESAGHGAET